MANKQTQGSEIQTLDYPDIIDKIDIIRTSLIWTTALAYVDPHYNMNSDSESSKN